MVCTFAPPLVSQPRQFGAAGSLGAGLPIADQLRRAADKLSMRIAPRNHVLRPRLQPTSTKPRPASRAAGVVHRGGDKVSLAHGLTGLSTEPCSLGMPEDRGLASERWRAGVDRHPTLPIGFAF